MSPESLAVELHPPLGAHSGPSGRGRWSWGAGDHALPHVTTTAEEADAVLSGDAGPLYALSSKTCCVWEQASQIRKESHF